MQNGLLIVGILAVILLYNVQCQEPITCTAGYYRPGETAKITCHYHGDITTDRNSGAYIQRHKLDARDSSSGMEVTVCHFSGGSVSVCDPEPGYRFVSFSSRNLTIDVPHVSAEFQGRYACGLVPPPGESPSRPVLSCLLVVEETSQPEQNVQISSGVHAGLYGHVQATLALLIIIIIAAVALIVYTAMAYNKTWFPFRKVAKPKKQDIEDGGEREPCNTKLIVQETTNPIFKTNVSGSPPPTAEPEKERLLSQGNDVAPRSASPFDVVGKGGKTFEAIPETEDERRDREDRERAERAEQEIRQEEENLKELTTRLGSAGKNDKKGIQKERDKSKQRLEKLRKEAQLLKKDPGKYEKERRKREEGERKEREKAEKGKK